MRLTQVLNLPPKFRYWKEFGAGKQKRMPYYKQWWYIWRYKVLPKKVADHTLKPETLPPGARVMEAADFLEGHIDAMPDEIRQRKTEKIVHDHPWPFNVQLDPIRKQQPIHNYTIDTRFFVPREDCQVLTNTLLETERMGANPPFEPNKEDLSTIERQFKWATEQDAVMKGLPRKREMPRLDQKPKSRTYGVPCERKEYNMMSSMSDFSQTLLAQYYHNQNDTTRLNEILARRSLSFPQCQTPFIRQSSKLNLDLCLDMMSLNQKPLPAINANPENTKERQPASIKPRGWKSLVEQTRQYEPDWSFTLPRNSHPHTIQVAHRIVREYKHSDEMLPRLMIHSFGLASQFARFREFTNETQREEENMSRREIVHTSEEKRFSPPQKIYSIIMEDPLSVINVDKQECLPEPVVLQAIGFDVRQGNFFFLRYQLNTLNFDDKNDSRIKNQAWYSGPIGDLSEALRYYIDFQAFDDATKMVERLELKDDSSDRVSEIQ